LTKLGQEAVRLKDPSILKRGEIALDLLVSGAPPQLINDLLPPSTRDIVDLAAAEVALKGATDVAAADDFATGWLQQQGIIPEGAPLIPGAAKTLLTVAEARAEDAIDWVQEGIDFITGRIGDLTGGSGITINAEGQISFGGGEPVDVSQAVGEWASFLERYAPAGVKERELARLGSGDFDRRLNMDRGVLLAADIIRTQGQSPEILADIREALGEDFTKSEINTIIAKARARAVAPRR
jgi:hypothetical protein